jgi:phage protein U
MRIATSQWASRVESIKLPDGQYTQSRKETLRELHRVHFPGSAGEEVTLEGQGQANLTAFAAHRQDWELSEKVIDQSKIRWVISTFKPLNWLGLMELYLHSCNKGSIT